MRVNRLIVKEVLPRNKPHVPVHLQPLSCKYSEGSQGPSERTQLSKLYKPLHITITKDLLSRNDVPVGLHVYQKHLLLLRIYGPRLRTGFDDIPLAWLEALSVRIAVFEPFEYVLLHVLLLHGFLGAFLDAGGE